MRRRIEIVDFEDEGKERLQFAVYNGTYPHGDTIAFVDELEHALILAQTLARQRGCDLYVRLPGKKKPAARKVETFAGESIDPHQKMMTPDQRVFDLAKSIVSQSPLPDCHYSDVGDALVRYLRGEWSEDLTMSFLKDMQQAYDRKRATLTE